MNQTITDKVKELEERGNQFFDKNTKENIAITSSNKVVLFKGSLFQVSNSNNPMTRKALENNSDYMIIAYPIDPDIKEIREYNFREWGTLCSISDVVSSGGTTSLNLLGLEKVKLTNFKLDKKNNNLFADVERFVEKKSAVSEAIQKVLMNDIKLWVEKNKPIVASRLRGVSLTSVLLDKVFSDINILLDFSREVLNGRFETCYEILSLNKTEEKLNYIKDSFEIILEERKVEIKVENKLRKDLQKRQKTMILQEKINAYKEELDKETGVLNTVDSFKERLKSGSFPKHIKERLEKEIKKLEYSPGQSQDANVTAQYIETLFSLPWKKATEDSLDIKKAKEVLDLHHFGLEKVKERIIERLSVIMRRKQMKSIEDESTSIICLVGPPGIGKTSLGQSIAETMNRKFVRVSLGGVNDESEIRGHRKTYVAASCGRIIKGMEKAGVVNPLFLLDEIDKMKASQQGDPAAAMLEVLDPSQNKTFSDNYVEEEYDLSKVLFICTANSDQTIPDALYDRMEIIYLDSYTEKEKLEIAKKHLIKKVLDSTSQTKKHLTFTDSAILSIIRGYTREAGVRDLQRTLEKIARINLVRNYGNLDGDKLKPTKITTKNLVEYLKKPIFEYQKKETKKVSGFVNGLAYTQYGGDVLPIEATTFPGRGNLILTGKLGEVFQESANIAIGYIKSNVVKFGIDFDFDKNDIHIHAPDGSTPKDGPSAGIALTSVILSTLLNKPISNDIGMTGEISLRGVAMSIGGLKEKSIAAQRTGLKKILIPKDNEKNIDDIPKEVREKLEIKTVSTYDEVFEEVFGVEEKVVLSGKKDVSLGVSV